MEARELRLGNYVYTQSGKLVVNRDSIYKVENVNMQSARKYEPIPLTEEWLEKLGFEKKSGREYSKGRFTYRFQQEDLIVEGYCYDYNGITCHPEYIHELQNIIFALTGEELSIK